MKTAVLLLGLVCAASLATADEAAKGRTEDDIREATFRYQFLHNASGLQQKAKVYYLAVGEKSGDPSDEFMKRFAGHQPPVKKKSQSKGGMVGPQEGGLIFNVRQIKWLNDSEVQVEGGYYEAGTSASWNTYYLKKKDDHWSVTKDVMNAIS